MAFQQPNEYMESSSLFRVSNIGKKFILYLFVLPTAVSLALVKEEDKVKKLVYYISKVLLGVETRYLKFENTYALMITARKLYHYFQA